MDTVAATHTTSLRPHNKPYKALTWPDLRGVFPSRLGLNEAHDIVKMAESIQTCWGTRLGDEYLKSVGVFEGYKLIEHIEYWLNRIIDMQDLLQMSRFDLNLDLPKTKEQWLRFFVIVAIVHDAGKPHALETGDVHQQHAFTIDLINHCEQTGQLPFTQDEYALARLLIGGPTDKVDPQVDYDAMGSIVIALSRSAEAKNGELTSEMRTLIVRVIESIERAADEGAFSSAAEREAYYRLLMFFFLCDSTSYSLAAGGIHSDYIAASYGFPPLIELLEDVELPRGQRTEIESLMQGIAGATEKSERVQLQGKLAKLTEDLIPANKIPRFEENEWRVIFTEHIDRVMTRFLDGHFLRKRPQVVGDVLEFYC